MISESNACKWAADDDDDTQKASKVVEQLMCKACEKRWFPDEDKVLYSL